MGNLLNKLKKEKNNNSIENQNGSWKYTFHYSTNQVTVEKGSATINGTSLTVVDSKSTLHNSGSDFVASWFCQRC